MTTRRLPLWLGVVAAAASIALTTLLVYPLKGVATDISLGVVYLVAVLFVASLWGVWLAIPTAVGSALAFNFFHIPPTGRFTIDEGENWVALVVFLIAAIVVSALADRSRHAALEASAAEADGVTGKGRRGNESELYGKSVHMAQLSKRSAITLAPSCHQCAICEGRGGWPRKISGGFRKRIAQKRSSPRRRAWAICLRSVVEARAGS